MQAAIVFLLAKRSADSRDLESSFQATCLSGRFQTVRFVASGLECVQATLRSHRLSEFHPSASLVSAAAKPAGDTNSLE